MDTQSGFRKGHSTATTLLKFKDDITKAMKKGEKTPDYSEITPDCGLLQSIRHG
jgi:hypothetical protein